jgi:hypothetical protein
MNKLLNAEDSRSQVYLDEELPVISKLLCGGTSGAVAQTSALYNA